MGSTGAGAGVAACACSASSCSCRLALSGLATVGSGTAALILLSLDAVQSVGTGLAYIALFQLGSIVGMALLSAALAIPMRLSITARLAGFHNSISVAVAVFTCPLGGLMVFHISNAYGLFT